MGGKLINKERVCLYCAKIFLADQGSINRGGGKYCSMSCSAKDRKYPPKKKCSINGCERSHYGKTYCQLHYKRNWVRGSPECVVPRGYNLPNPFYASLKDSFESKFIKGAENECWLWKASITKWGYGQLNWKRKVYRAHRLSYEFYKGEIAEGLFVCHRCDNRLCINPNHLFLGTADDNAKDMVSKNRSAKGEHHSHAKLKGKDVIDIRKMLKSGLSNGEIAIKFNVKPGTIKDIKNGRNWSHVV